MLAAVVVVFENAVEALAVASVVESVTVICEVCIPVTFDDWVRVSAVLGQYFDACGEVLPETGRESASVVCVIKETCGGVLLEILTDALVEEVDALVEADVSVVILDELGTSVEF